MKEFVQNKYNAGDTVYAKANPSEKLVIRRYIDKVYYCKVMAHPERKELVYFEREIIEDLPLEALNREARDNPDT
ncbi:hypothetical protein AB9P05_16180 [Roseivirga sp. BDSF3-8]|uniref:hypothetical protein n=1 Tax=Roseivirga sp. BDSF3-8 TaxID=3241598 RepID=UPI0035319056